MGGEVAGALNKARPELVPRLILIDSPSEKSVLFNAATDAYLTPIVGELLFHFITDKAIRNGLIQGFAPGLPVPDQFVADARQLTYTAFKKAHEDSEAFQAEQPAYLRLSPRSSPRLGSLPSSAARIGWCR